MIAELLTELRTQATERLRSPLIGAFVIGWVVANWKLLAVLLFSSTPVENRITLIERDYLHLSHLLLGPAAFAVAFSVLSPWMNLGVQFLQELANSRRRKHRLIMHTEYLIASVGRAQAQAQLNRILARDLITQQQQDEISILKKQLTEQANSAHSRIAAREAELENLRQEYSKVSSGDSETALRQREEMERLMAVLEDERKQAIAARETLVSELLDRQGELEARLESTSQAAPAISSEELKRVVMSKKFRLYHNPKVGPERSKAITFEASGQIGDGGNANEHSWQVKNGTLELVQADGRVHSRFLYYPESGIFIHTGDKDTRSVRGQFIIPERQ